MVENQTTFGCGLAVFIISIASVVVWMHNQQIFLIIYVIGSVCFVVSGILYFAGGMKNHRDIIYVAFGFGIPAWALILISCIVGIGWNQSNLAIATFQAMIWLYYAIEALTTLDPVMMQLLLILEPQITPYRVGYIGSMIHIGLIIPAFILGIIALRAVEKGKW